MSKVVVAMSGGVDSAVAAYLILQAGHEAIGATMKLYRPNCPLHPDRDTGVLIPDDAEDARRIADTLGMPFTVLDCEGAFRSQVIEPFIKSYEAALTPNPCILCNKYLKFGMMWDMAEGLGASHLATGHYARIQRSESGRFLLRRAADLSKDQSYVLYHMTQTQLSHTLFPLGDYTKAQARELAQSHGFINAHKHDSQDICFIPDGDYAAFITQYTGKTFPAGKFVDLSGQVLGEHSGIIHYTVGQRKGLGIALGKPVYVCRKSAADNTVTLGDNADLFSDTLEADSVNFIPFDTLDAPMKVTARVRYNMPPQPATVWQTDTDRICVTFETPQRAVTPGQSVVLYDRDGDYVIGGGVIQ